MEFDGFGSLTFEARTLYPEPSGRVSHIIVHPSPPSRVTSRYYSRNRHQARGKGASGKKPGLPAAFRRGAAVLCVGFCRPTGREGDITGAMKNQDLRAENRSLQRNVLLVATLSSFLTPYMASSVVVSLPSMAHDLSMKVITLSWVSTGYLLAAAAFCVPFGRASDIFGRKRIFTIGILLDIFASILGACAT